MRSFQEKRSEKNQVFDKCCIKVKNFFVKREQKKKKFDVEGREMGG